MNLALEAFEQTEEEEALKRFRNGNPDLFEKNDSKLLAHLAIVFCLLSAGTMWVITTPFLVIKIVMGVANAFLWFSLINVTIHHHHTHHNAAQAGFAKRLLDFLYRVVVPNAPKRLGRYTRAHLNHHARPFHETDVDHHYGQVRYLRMKKSLWTRLFYFLELTFVGGHVPGWADDRYLNQVPVELWKRSDYETVKGKESRAALVTSFLQWMAFGIFVWFLPALAWGWIFPMLLVKNWAHFLGQFQHYDERLLDPNRSISNRTKTYRFAGWLNYLAGGEISGHFLHHLFPQMPYYKLESARKRFLNDSELSAFFVTY